MPPLVVDLDGTLLRSDLLLETGVAFVRKHPLQLLKPLAWLMQGKAVLKEQLAIATDVDVTVLPYDPDVIEIIKVGRQNGRTIVLATASHETLAHKIAEHLQIFDVVHATKGKDNVNAERKQELLVSHYGEGGYDYLGNSMDDIPVWKSARHSYVVNPESGVEKNAAKLGNVHTVIKNRANLPKAWMKALRLHQWLKNILIFVPLLAAHELANPPLFMNGVLAFVLFGICASSVYVLNDLLDLSDDRHHSSKKKRAFASGNITIRSGLLVFPVLLLLAFGGAWLLLPMEFVLALTAYYILTLAYSLSLKRMVAIDVIALALLYTMRIIAGALALGLTLTFWMLAFSMFMFLSLALVKRYAELKDARKKGLNEKTRGRGYYPSDLEMISSLGASSGYLSVMVLALYLHDQATIALYRYPHLIWIACPLLLFWITRIWLLTHRGQMHDDPVVFATRDRISLIVGGLFCLAFWAAT